MAPQPLCHRETSASKAPTLPLWQSSTSLSSMSDSDSRAMCKPSEVPCLYNAFI